LLDIGDSSPSDPRQYPMSNKEYPIMKARRARVRDSGEHTRVEVGDPPTLEMIPSPSRPLWQASPGCGLKIPCERRKIRSRGLCFPRALVCVRGDCVS
jgi:hypothetical protein